MFYTLLENHQKKNLTKLVISVDYHNSNILSVTCISPPPASFQKDPFLYKVKNVLAPKDSINVKSHYTSIPSRYYRGGQKVR